MVLPAGKLFDLIVVHAKLSLGFFETLLKCPEICFTRFLI